VSVAARAAVDRAVPVRLHGVAAAFGPRIARVLPLLVWLSFPAGAIVLAYSFSYAATHTSGQKHFLLFWLGVLLFTVPAFLRLCQRGLGRAERLALAAAIGLVDYLPKYLRAPSFPLFHDEHAHSRQADVVASSGHPFEPNPIVPITEFFPGLHSLTVWLHDVSGVGQYELNVILLAGLHAAALLGVFVIAETAFASARIAGLAAFLYGLNPSFMWFNSQYAYQSLAIVLYIWVIAALLRLEASHSRPVRVGWFAAGVALAGASVVTHHLTSYFMVATLMLAQLLITARARRGRQDRGTARVTGTFTLAVSAMTGAWLLFIASGTPGYLAPHLTGALREIGRLIYREQSARVFFEHSTAPGYEKLSAYLSPVIVGVAVVGGLYLLWKRRPATSGPWALAVLGLSFFASFPVMLTSLGVEGAERTWAFSYLGLAVLIAPVIPWLLNRRRVRSTRMRKAGLLASLTVAVCVVLIGNVSMHTNVEYRFPGAFVYGSDTRSLTRELIGTASWFRRTYGTGENVVTDRYSGLALASIGRGWWALPSPALPTWELLLRTDLPSRELLRDLRDGGYRYLVVDERMSRFLPRVGVYLVPGEPGADSRKRPVPRAALAKFERLPWTIKVYESDHLSIYRFNFAVVDLDQGRRRVAG
jgi:hypothetical protein